MKILTQLKTYLQELISNLLNSISSFEIGELSSSISEFCNSMKLTSLVQVIESLDLIYRNSK